MNVTGYWVAIAVPRKWSNNFFGMTTLLVDVAITPGEVDLSPETKNAFLGWLSTRVYDESTYERLRSIQLEKAQRHPLCASIASLAVYDCERHLCALYLVSEKDDTLSYGLCTVKLRSEAGLLQEFWQGASYFDTFVTFDGRRIAVPFLMHRSRVHAITPTRMLYEGRYPAQQHSCRHIDLLDELTLYGALRRPHQVEPWLESLGITTETETPFGSDAVPAGALEAYQKIIALQKMYTRVVPAADAIF